jgi:hypothetical protein
MEIWPTTWHLTDGSNTTWGLSMNQGNAPNRGAKTSPEICLLRLHRPESFNVYCKSFSNSEDVAVIVQNVKPFIIDQEINQLNS